MSKKTYHIRVFKDLAYGSHNPKNLLDLHIPDEKKGRLPLIVVIHGGGWGMGCKEVHSWMAEYFAQHGFAVAAINYRLRPKFLWPHSLNDVQRAVRWLRSQAGKYNLDPKRFGGFGSSAGAHLASFLGLIETQDNRDKKLAKYSSKIQCVVDCYGPVDFVYMMKSASDKIIEKLMNKPLKGNEEAYRRASPSFNVTPNPPPFLIMHGTLDVGEKQGQVPIEISEQFYKKLRKAGSKATFIKLKGATHGFSASSTNPYVPEALKAMMAFYKKHLKLGR